MKKIVIAISIMSCATVVFAWGPREQGALAGIVAGVVIDEAIRNDEPRYVQPPRYYVEPPRYYQPYQPPVYVQPRQQCWNAPSFDYYGNVTGYRIVCR